jgi:hypothetical protein
MPRKEPRKIEPIVSLETGSEFTWIRINVVDLDHTDPPKKAKKYRPAWNVIGGLSASLSSFDLCGGKCGGDPKK